MSNCVSQNRLSETPVFYATVSEKRFSILLKFLHFADNEAYCGQVPPKICKVKPVSDGYVPEDQLSAQESLLLWKGQLGWKVHSPKKRSHFGMESYKMCEAKMRYVWNMLWYTGNEIKLTSEIHEIDISYYSKPKKMCSLSLSSFSNRAI
jgi:hypothetical protein